MYPNHPIATASVPTCGNVARRCNTWKDASGVQTERRTDIQTEPVRERHNVTAAVTRTNSGDSMWANSTGLPQ